RRARRHHLRVAPARRPRRRRAGDGPGPGARRPHRRDPARARAHRQRDRRAARPARRLRRTMNTEEQAIVEVVREFVDHDVRPVVRELEHANTYPEKLIEQMKELGIYGLAVPEPWGEVAVSMSCCALVTAELARGWVRLAGAV